MTAPSVADLDVGDLALGDGRYDGFACSLGGEQVVASQHRKQRIQCLAVDFRLVLLVRFPLRSGFGLLTLLLFDAVALGLSGSLGCFLRLAFGLDTVLFRL